MEPVVLMVGAILGLLSTYHSPNFKTPAKEELVRWEQSSLSSDTLLSKLTSDYCHHSLRNFLSCANALDNVAFHLGVRFLPPGKIVADMNYNFQEKERIKDWHMFYKNKPKVDFKSLGESLLFSKTSISNHKFLTAMGINGLLSVAFDPHTYLKPTNDLDLIEKDSNVNLEFNENEELDNEELVSPFQEKIVVTTNKTLIENSITLSLSEFSIGSCGQIKKEIINANNDNIKKIILDLKSNPGGLVHEASCIASLFVGKKHIVSLKGFNNREEKLIGINDQLSFQELEVLVDNYSASSSEILAGVLQHYKRGLIIGETTYGKGTFQNSINSKWSKYNVQLMKTSGYFFTPSGYCPQLKGLIPDKLTKTLLTREDDLFLFPRPMPEN